MNKKITTRSYIETDAAFLAAIYFHTIHKINAKDYSREQLDAWAPKSHLEAENWIHKWQKLPPIVALIDDKIVGFAELEDNGHIDCFYCHHKYQGCGVGSALMREIEDRARKNNLNKIFAEVSITAKPFFEAKGFIVKKEQSVIIRGIALTNFVMEKILLREQNDMNPKHCPCGTGKAYMDCCGIFISNQKTPSTPEELMRSRYTAYNRVNLDYIAQTMKSPAAENFDAEDAREWAKKVNWVKLEVIKTTHDFNKGIVEFRAYYDVDDKKNILHEISEFNFENGRWYYVNGTQPNKKFITSASEKIGRNDTCPCGSNKKYKKCCGNFI